MKPNLVSAVICGLALCGCPHLTLSPTTAATVVDDKVQFHVSDTYNRTIDLSQVYWMTTGGTVDSTTAVYTAPDHPGNFEVWVTPILYGEYFGEGGSEPAQVAVLPLGLSPPH